MLCCIFTTLVQLPVREVPQPVREQGRRGRASGARLGHRRRLPGVLLGHADDPQKFQGVRARSRAQGRQRRTRPPRVLKPLYAVISGSSTARSRSARSSWSPRSFRSATRSGWRRSPDGGRSASCGWSAPRAGTSSCRSCSRRSSRRCGLALAALAIGGFMGVVIYGVLGDSTIVPWVSWADAGWVVGVIAVLGVAMTLLPTLLLTRKYLRV